METKNRKVFQIKFPKTKSSEKILIENELKILESSFLSQ